MLCWGCAQIGTSDKANSLTLQQVHELSCLSSFGKGRLTGPQRKVVFEYESVYQNNHWKMALMLPVHGQELLGFRWRLLKKKVGGQFIGRAIENFKTISSGEGAREAKLLKQSWKPLERSVALVFASLEFPEEFCQSSKEGRVCREESGQEIFWNLGPAQATATVLLSERLQMQLRFYDKQKDGLRRFELFVHELPKGPHSRPTLGLELFANSCELP